MLLSAILSCTAQRVLPVLLASLVAACCLAAKGTHALHDEGCAFQFTFLYDRANADEVGDVLLGVTRKYEHKDVCFKGKMVVDDTRASLRRYTRDKPLPLLKLSKDGTADMYTYKGKWDADAIGEYILKKVPNLAKALENEENRPNKGGHAAKLPQQQQHHRKERERPKKGKKKKGEKGKRKAVLASLSATHGTLNPLLPELRKLQEMRTLASRVRDSLLEEEINTLFGDEGDEEDDGDDGEELEGKLAVTLEAHLVAMHTLADDLDGLPFGSFKDFRAFADAQLHVLDAIVGGALRSDRDFSREASRVAKFLRSQNAGSTTNAAKALDYRLRLDVLKAYTEKGRIPNIVHFIKTDGDADNFGLLQYLSIAAASHFIKPAQIYFHCTTVPRGHWWTRARPFLTIKEVPVDRLQHTINGQQVFLAAHQSDFLRIDILIEHGGIYMDWDVMPVRSFQDLLGSSAVMGLEKKIHNYGEVLGVAVMMSRKNSPWMKRFRKEMYKKFDGRNCYTCHSTMAAKDLGWRYPAELTVLDHTGFYFPGWTRDAVDLMFDESRIDFGADRDGVVRQSSLLQGYALHMFESNEHFHTRGRTLLLADNFLLPRQGRNELNMKRQADSNFMEVFREFFVEEDRLCFAKKDGVVVERGTRDEVFGGHRFVLWNLPTSMQKKLKRYMRVDGGIEMQLAEKSGLRTVPLGFEEVVTRQSGCYADMKTKKTYPVRGFSFYSKQGPRASFEEDKHFPVSLRITFPPASGVDEFFIMDFMLDSSFPWYKSRKQLELRGSKEGTVNFSYD
jgi:hypothetical protein